MPKKQIFIKNEASPNTEAWSTLFFKRSSPSAMASILTSFIPQSDWRNFEERIKSRITSKRTRIIILLIFLVGLSSLFIYNLVYFKKIYPGIYISGVSVSGLKRQEAINMLKSTITTPDKIYLTYDSQTFEIDLETYDFYYDFEESTNLAYKKGRSGNILKDIATRLTLLFKKVDLDLTPRFDEETLSEHLSIIAGEIYQEPVYPTLTLVDGVVLVDKGTSGKEIDYDKLWSIISLQLSQNITLPIKIPIVVVDPTITDSEAGKLRMRAEKLIGKNIKLTFNNEEFLLEENDLFSFLSLNGNNKRGDEIIEEISLKLNREPQNPIFVFKSDRIVEFAPAKEGIGLDSQKLEFAIIEKLANLETSEDITAVIVIPVEVEAPDITTEEVNNLGIKELIGRGSSRFSGSIPSRIHNIGLASSHFNGVLVAPGELFSFNEVLGDVSSYTGYKQAYIIRDGRTVLGDGGGVCQVSTTLFRAILASGLPVVERRAHSYRVAYYEQGSPPGLDATVFSPSTDLKFQNDTPSHILIQTIFDPSNNSLVFEIYGTKDGRVATTTKPIVYGVTAPPPDLYQDDPTLPVGTTKQVDYKAWGANVSFSYQVEKDGEIIFQKNFISNYRPWQSVFLRGTGPVN